LFDGLFASFWSLLQALDLKCRGLREGANNGQLTLGAVEYNHQDPATAEHADMDALGLGGRIV